MAAAGTHRKAADLPGRPPALHPGVARLAEARANASSCRRCWRRTSYIYDGNGEVPSQIHGYLSTNFKELRNLPKGRPALRAKARDRWYVPDPRKAGDLEKLRERALLREFDDYRDSAKRRLRMFRLEAVRAGFRRAWQQSGLRHHHRRRSEDPGRGAPGRLQTAHVVRPSRHSEPRNTGDAVKISELGVVSGMNVHWHPLVLMAGWRRVDGWYRSGNLAPEPELSRWG